MTIGILLCGEIPATLEAKFEPYSGMIRALLGPRSATVFDVQSGELPGSISACQAYLITGSSAGVYDGLPWINELMAFLRNARGGSKLIGICFWSSGNGPGVRRLRHQIAERVGNRSPSLRVAGAAALDG
jgi:hypothetical protein